MIQSIIIDHRKSISTKSESQQPVRHVKSNGHDLPPALGHLNFIKKAKFCWCNFQNYQLFSIIFEATISRRLY